MQSLHHHSPTLTLHTDVTFICFLYSVQHVLHVPAHEEEDEGDDAEDADDDGDTNEDRGSPEGRGENGSEVIQTASADIGPVLAEMVTDGQIQTRCIQTAKD